MLKVMIADDEERICQLIKALVDWESLNMEVVGIAHNGLEASEMVENLEPQILITDIRMPGCNGLELIETVKAKNPLLEIIIISGYAHFAYAQTAIKFGVGDYLLKPINKSEIISTLCKLKERIEDRLLSEQNTKQLRQKSANDIRRLQGVLLEQLIEQKEKPLTDEELQNEYYLGVGRGVYQAFWLAVDEQRGERNQARSATVLEKVQEMLESSLRNRCMEMLIGQRKNSCVGFLNYEKEKQEEIRRVLRDCLNRLESGRVLYGAVTFSLALGCVAMDASGLKDSFKEAQVIIQERLVRGSGRLLERMPQPSALQGQKLLEKYLRQIGHAIETISLSEADGALQAMQQAALEIKDVHGYEIHELVLSAASLFLSQVDIGSRAEELRSFEELCGMCGDAELMFSQLGALQTKYLETMSKQHETDTARPIRLAKQYIQNHYSEPITQEEVSGAVGLSAAYFSVLFKKVEGEGFAKYLINIRMEQAKVLLRETTIPVSKICQQVGYNDLKHFTHTFEKVAGVKPTVYRKLYG